MLDQKETPDMHFEEDILELPNESVPEKPSRESIKDSEDNSGQRDLDSDEFDDEMTGESPSMVQPGWKISDSDSKTTAGETDKSSKQRSKWDTNPAEVKPKQNVPEPTRQSVQQPIPLSQQT